MWTVRFTDRFRSQTKVLSTQYPRLEEAVDGVQWALERKPEEGICFFRDSEREIELWCLKLDPWPGVPRAILYYTFSPHTSTVTVYSIMPTDSHPENVAM